MIFVDRFYRDLFSTKRWDTYRVKVESSDLYIRTKGDFSSFVKKKVSRLRKEVKAEIKRHPEFLTSFTPIEPVNKELSKVTKMMYHASKQAGVGPMAAVAGAIAHLVGEELKKKSEEVIVENGGDIYLSIKQPVKMTIFAGESPFSGKIGIKISPSMSPLGICTSSGTIGHSFSFGKADAFTVVSKDTALSDAVATGGANRIKSKQDIESAIEYAMGIKGIIGVIAIYKDVIGVKGNIELCKII